MHSKEVSKRINDIGIVPCARVRNPDHVRFAAETLCAAGIPVLEVPLTVPKAAEVIEELAKRFPDLIIGAGTVLDETAAQRCLDAGARFITSPGLVLEVVACAKRADVCVYPGALTPSEVIAAWKAGGDFVKIFPCAQVGGDQYIRALKIPLPQIPLIASGGVNQLTAANFIFAGASSIGIGSELMPRKALVTRQDQWIHELARRYIEAVKNARIHMGGKDSD